MTTYIADHPQRARDLLGSKVKSVDHVQEIVSAIADEVQVVEDSTYDVALSRSVEFATGDQLDKLGALVGERRDTLDDNTYRRFIAGAIQIKRSLGTAPQMIELVSTLTGSPDVRLIGTYPAAFAVGYVVPEAFSSSLRARIKDRVLRGAPAGVEVQLIESVGTMREGDTLLLDVTPGFDGPGMGDLY